MALLAGRTVVVGSRSSGLVCSEKQGNGQCVSDVQCAVRITPAPRYSSSRLVSKRQLHAIDTNSRGSVLELEEREALEFLPKSEFAGVAKEEDAAPSGPSAHEIHNLLMQVCDETSSIAEVELKMGTFSLRVRREIGKAPKPVAQGPPVLGKAKAVNTNGSPSAPTKSTKLTKTTPSKADVDGGLLFVASPKVGLFRQGRTVRGKSGPPLCVEGQLVKKGQVVCYLEQLGTQQPVEADIGGEVEKILFKDGETVGYGDRLIAIRP